MEAKEESQNEAIKDPKQEVDFFKSRLNSAELTLKNVKVVLDNSDDESGSKDLYYCLGAIDSYFEISKIDAEKQVEEIVDEVKEKNG